MKKMSLNNTKVGQLSKVYKINKESLLKRRLLDIGFTTGTEVETVLSNFGGNLVAYMVRGALIAIRDEDAGHILVEVA